MANHSDSSGRDPYEPGPVSPMSSFDHSDRQFQGGPESHVFLDKNGQNETTAAAFGTPKSVKSKSPGFFAIWWPELIACFLVLGSFCALIGTIYPFENQPLPRWPYGLSINTLISIYTIIFDMALMMIVSSGLGQLKFLWFQQARQLSDLQTFDQGAKGAWGALVFLWVIKAKHAVASIGALIIILLLFIAPLNQQIVRYHPCSEIDWSTSSSIARTNLADSTGGIHTGAMLSNVDLAAQAAINVGMFNDERAKITPVCSSGNCTFNSEYSSAGYCSICRDFTDQIITKKKDKTTQMQNISVTDWEIESDGAQFGFVLGPAGYDENSPAGPGVRMIFGTGNDTTRKQQYDDCGGTSAPSNWTCLGFGAAECRVVPCARRYNATVHESEFTEKTVSQSTELGSNLGDGGFAFSTIDMQCVNSTEKDFLRSKNYVFDDSTQWLKYNLSQGIFTSIYNASSSLRDKCIYQGTNLDINAVGTYFATFFNGYIITQSQYIGEGSSNAGRALFNMRKTNFTFIEEKFDNLAAAMTVYTRNRGTRSGSNASEPIEGDVLKMNSCVVVRWPWLILEAFVLVLGAIFFATTLFMVSKARDERFQHDFKTSVLPLLYLFHGMDGEVQKPSAPGVNTVGGIQQHAESMRVRLMRDEKGWGFRTESGA